MTMFSSLSLAGEKRLAYTLTEGKAPTVLFLSGFKSDMTGSKALALEAHCRAHGRRFIRFDYSGHGQSSGRFQDGTIGEWKQDALAIIDKLGGESILLVGSSMGGWLALLCALERKDRILGLIGIASAPDFTEKLIWDRLSPSKQGSLMESGVYLAPSCYGEEPYPITRKLIEDGRNHLLLDASIALNIPIRLLHGMKDEDVPYATSQRLMERLASPDVTLQLIKNGDHRLSGPDHLMLLCDTVESLSTAHE